MEKKLEGCFEGEVEEETKEEGEGVTRKPTVSLGRHKPSKSIES